MATAAAPGYADRDEVPDAGDRPSAAGQVPMPDGSLARPPTAADQVIDGPLAAEIAEVEIEIEGITRQLQTIGPDVGPAESAVEYAEEQWLIAVAEYEEAQQELYDLVGESFRGAAALPPELYLPQLPRLRAHAPLPVDAPIGARGAARDLVNARAAEQAAAELLSAAQDAEQSLSELQEELETELAGLREELDRLRDRNTELIAEETRAQEAAAQEGATDRYPAHEPVDGFEAHPDALRAVEFALSQLGKPYQWGAEGPHRYDCSGLMWAAYRHVGQRLPRVAANQYQGTRDRLITRSAAVAQDGLLPGDLVFFSSGPSWQSIHHVGMYVGDGQMVHAPNRNEVVKVSPVWWSRFFGATRVIGAVPGDGAAPGPTPTPSPSDTPSPTPGPTPGPTSTSSPIDPTDPGDPPTSPPGGTDDPTPTPTPTPTRTSAPTPTPPPTQPATPTDPPPTDRATTDPPPTDTSPTDTAPTDTTPTETEREPTEPATGTPTQTAA